MTIAKIQTRHKDAVKEFLSVLAKDGPLGARDLHAKLAVDTSTKGVCQRNGLAECSGRGSGTWSITNDGKAWLKAA